MKRERLDIGGGCPLASLLCLGDGRFPTARLVDLRDQLSGFSPGEVRELAVAGGEPLAHPAIGEVLAACRSVGVQHIELRSHALDGSLLAQLCEQYVDHLVWRVPIPSLDSTVAGLFFADEGAFRASLRGVETLVASGAEVWLEVAVAATTGPGLAETLGEAKRRWPGLTGAVLAWLLPPQTGPRSRALSSLYVSPTKAEPALRAAAERARDVGLKLAMARETPVVPCLFRDPAALADLFWPGPGVPAEDRRGACGVCLLADSCLGPRRVPRVHFTAAGGVRPLRDPKNALLRPRPVERTLFGTVEESLSVSMGIGEDGSTVCHEVVLRLTDRCNQRCPFCWVQLSPADLPDEVVRAQVERTVELSPRQIAISGGEPTLTPDLLVSVVSELAERTNALIVLQTNATRLARDDLAGRLAQAGLGRAFVSLHSHVEHVYDQMTGSRGQLERALQGIDALLAAGVSVVANHVLSGTNIAQFPDFVAFLAERFDRRVLLTVSSAHPIGPISILDDAGFGAFLLRLPEAEPYLRTALDWCRANGQPFTGLGGQCGFPPCVLGGDLAYFDDLPEGAVEAQSDDFIKAPQCTSCRLNARCVGVRAFYAWRHGLDDLEPIS